jgi:tRNA pseudouridine38-40 synthase
MSKPHNGGHQPCRWKCVCAYDGRTFSGWQSQTDGKAIQDLVEKRLSVIFGMPLRTHASGRTDAGVHARGQVFHFDADWKHGAKKLASALAAGLPQTIQIKSVKKAPAGFHARFSVTGKIYRYHLYVGDPDPFTRPYCWGRLHDINYDAMKAAAALLVGKHDFRAFSALNRVRRENTVRTLQRLDLVRRGPRIVVTAEADGFLYKMVRSLVGALVAVGQGKLALDRIPSLFDGAIRTYEVPTAPAQGLFLEKVKYGKTAMPGQVNEEED